MRGVTGKGGSPEGRKKRKGVRGKEKERKENFFPHWGRKSTTPPRKKNEGGKE